MNRNFTRSLFASLLAGIGLFFGVVPEFAWESPRLSFTFLAYTQDFSEGQIVNYARAILQLEPHRQQAYQSIQRIIGQSPPAITCSRYRDNANYKNLSSTAQKIFADYCATSVKIIKKNDLSADQFNNITTRVQSDQELKRRIQNAMIRIRQQK